ncbi:protein SMAX1-LIKE 3-like [Salvia miltiorrhiza]|uniref:protein SMAX1-LIKE 3-like n=1 Tax=Salvia miltiorrhiza TaxID=226208 RepID=UPI0025ACBFA4|nr:protein SMAX1-LIKE 3-like [Salvia miltiorrhiza]
MRSGGCAVQQALTSEAAGMVKQAVVVAKRRGHAQVTPLHVANSMLAAAGGVLRSACQQSHSHPLQCKALELCFNVALNRLPATANPIHYPSISNALVAAFKRAQAHQRRGAADTQQQAAAALLAVKIELEQLIISILDDPSVSRVMREAGFSSTQVKNNVEKSIASELRPQPPRRSRSRSRSNEIQNKVVILDPDNEDSNIIIETLVISKRNRNLVVVGESVSSVEKAVRRLMERVEGGQVPEALSGLKFVSIPPFYTFCNVRRELVQQKIQELGFLAKSLVREGVVLYLGDLNWISEYRVSNVERGRRERSYYCSVEHMIMELGRLVSSLGSGGRIWLLGIATFQTYIRCRNGYDSLETIWRLHPLTIPANSLGLSLVPHGGNEAGTGLDCSSSDFGGEEAQNLQLGPTLLPSWLKDESKRLSNYNDQEVSNNRQPKSLEKTLTLSCASPSSSTSCFSSDQRNPNLQKLHLSPSSNLSSAGKFKEFNAQNLNILCNALEEKVPWQKAIIPEIAGTILQCRSGMLRRKSQGNVEAKEETWLCFLGPDARAKREIARNLAECVFGSYSKLVCLSSCGEGLAAAVSENPHRVFLVEDFELADRSWRRRIKGAIERGRVRAENGEEFGLCDAIVVLSCERLGSVRNAEEEEEDVSLDLNMCLRGHDDLGILQNVDSLLLF